MPELPEVETMVRDLAQRVVGRTLVEIEAPFPGIVRSHDLPEFERRVVGGRIDGVRRRGKYAALYLASGEVLIVHRGMSGSLLLRQAHEPMEGHVRIVFRLDNGLELRFNDPRKFGKILLVPTSSGEEMFPWARMGPEPLGPHFTEEYLATRLARRAAKIKPLLLDQRLVAGLGNIYVDEALHRAGIHPGRRADTLGTSDIERLHEAIRYVLQTAVAHRGTTFDSYRDLEGRQGGFQESLQVFRREKSACPRCGSTIVKLVVAGRGTHICPTCQPAV